MLISGRSGGRIVPSFTRNWLAQRRHLARPMPFGRVESVVLALTLVALGVWVIWPVAWSNVIALRFWQGWLKFGGCRAGPGRHTGAEALVWVLHAGYAFVPWGSLPWRQDCVYQGWALPHNMYGWRERSG